MAKLDLSDFDSIQLCMPDFHSVPRGKVVSGELKETLVQEGLDCWNGAPLVGPNSELPSSLAELCGVFPSHELRPCPDTLSPWPWVSSEGRPVGSVLCDMYRPDGTPDLHCPRQLLRHQLDALWQEHGMLVRSAFEYEFFAFREGSLEPLGGERAQFMDLRVWGRHQELMSRLTDTLRAARVTVRTLQPEYSPGQWELTTPPYQGLRGADVGFYVKNAVKGFLGTRGYHATFMTRPTLGGVSSGLHLNHSLWRPGRQHGQEGGGGGADDVNVLAGEGGEGLSDSGRQWVAGLLTHTPALTALLCPSLNCYRRLHGLCAPSLPTWGPEDRNATVRLRRLKGGTVFLENRLPSAAASPYLALAATLAAGRDGLRRGLQCPAPGERGGAGEVPRTLEEALCRLEEDRELGELLGQGFVQSYVQAKRETELLPYQQQHFESDEDRIAFERNMYFNTY